MEKISGIESIVERQVRRWEKEKKRRSQSAESSIIWPSITISREYGARGLAIGRAVASSLGFGFWDQEIVNAVSEKTGLDAQLLDSLDEHTRNAVDVFLDALLRNESFSVGDYLRELMRIVTTVSAHGAAVFIGRGTQFVLPGDRALHVRIVATEEQKVSHIASTQNLSRDEALREIERIENERRTFIRRHYAEDVTQSSHYDVVVNSGTNGVDGAATLIKEAYRARFGKIPNLDVSTAPAALGPVID
ncbi:MAG: AAA family ATPase [Bradymonadia bacterium]